MNWITSLLCSWNAISQKLAAELYEATFLRSCHYIAKCLTWWVMVLRLLLALESCQRKNSHSPSKQKIEREKKVKNTEKIIKNETIAKNILSIWPEQYTHFSVWNLEITALGEAFRFVHLYIIYHVLPINPIRKVWCQNLCCIRWVTFVELQQVMKTTLELHRPFIQLSKSRKYFNRWNDWIPYF